MKYNKIPTSVRNIKSGASSVSNTFKSPDIKDVINLTAYKCSYSPSDNCIL